MKISEPESLRLSYLDEFVHLAMGLSFNSTAKELHISQSSLSNHIMVLERAMGSALINRSVPISLTPQGHILLKYAQEILDLIGRAEKECTESIKNMTGTVRVRLPHYPGETLRRLIEAIREFRQEYPHVNVELHEKPGEEAARLIAVNAIDCTLLTQQLCLPDPGPAANLRIAPFCQDEASVWISRDVPTDADGRMPASVLNGKTLVIRANLDSSKTEESTRLDLEHYGIRSRIVHRQANSKEEFLLSISGDEAVLMPTGYFDNAAVKLADDRTVALLDPPLNVTSYLAFRIPSGNDPNADAIRLFESFVRLKADKSLA